MSADARRSTRLLFDAELAAGRIGGAAVERLADGRAAARPSVPRAPRRIAQRLAMKAGYPAQRRGCVAPLMAMRRELLGDAAAGPPRLLVRVDEFPHYRAMDLPERYGSASFARFHAIMAAARVPYLLAVLPRLAQRPLDPAATGGRPLDDDERRMLEAVAADGVTFALHGLDHRTRRRDPRRRSELAGLPADALARLLDEGERVLAQLGIAARVFVAPYNRFDAAQWPALAARYDVVCGGPESVVAMGFQRTPAWIGDAVYLPAYPPLYGRAAEIAPAVDELARGGVSLWTPVVLHWGVERDEDWAGLQDAVERIAPYARPWGEFLAAVEASR